MKLFEVLCPIDPPFHVWANNAREARAEARFYLGRDKLPKGTTVSPNLVVKVYS